jgi:hypothetical protein
VALPHLLDPRGGRRGAVDVVRVSILEVGKLEGTATSADQCTRIDRTVRVVVGRRRDIVRDGHGSGAEGSKRRKLSERSVVYGGGRIRPGDVRVKGNGYGGYVGRNRERRGRMKSIRSRGADPPIVRLPVGPGETH